MKDAKGHGSDPRGGPAHQQGVAQVGRPVPLHPNVLNVMRSNPGGFSVTPGGQQPSNGYMVSLPGHTLIVDEHDLAGAKGAEIMQNYARDHASALRQSGAHFGGWTDQASGKTYLDISQNIKNRNAAVRAGQSRNQIAIWDVRKGREISTGGSGK